MSDAQEPTDWRALPKVELHLHLEGAAPPEFVRDRAARHGEDVSRIFGPDGAYARGDFAAFLRAYEAAASVIRTPEDYAALTRAALEEAAEQGVVYLEAFTSPSLCAGGAVGPWREHVDAVAEAAALMEPAITLRLTATAVRHLGPDAARASAICAAETEGSIVTGFGMGGDEAAGRAADFAWAFDCAREAGLGITCHAGEWGGPAAIRETLEALRPSRLGHGVRAADDPRLVEDLAERGTVLEVCPGSNVALGIYPDVARHPIARLRDAGVAVTVSTDDPPFFDTTPSAEWAALERAFGWGPDDLADLNRVALGAAFCDEATRERVGRRLEPARPEDA